MSQSSATLLVFGAYMLAVFGLAIASNRLGRGKSFLAEYFLGSRGLGTWALAFTFAASMASGGSFTGFPAKVYSHGWVVAFWIAGYMIFPLLTMGLLGKRLNQAGRRCNAITIPDLIRERYDSPALGLAATAGILFFAVVNLIAQFKAGGLILGVVLESTPGYQDIAESLGQSLAFLTNLPFIRADQFDAAYASSLVFFALIVIFYTAYGGFRAVVWTDVLQGVVMGLGVILLLPLMLYAVGGLSKANDQIAKMPPTLSIGSFQENNAVEYTASDRNVVLYIEHRFGDVREPQITVKDHPQPQSGKLIEILLPQDVDNKSSMSAQEFVDWFNATDPAKLYCGIKLVDPAHTKYTGPIPDQALGMGLVQTTDGPQLLVDGQHRVFGPGRKSNGDPFLPFMTALGFFIMWGFSGAGQPHTMVRLMAFKDTQVLRRAIVTVTIYYFLIYVPLILIFVASQALVHPAELAGSADRIMPTVVVKVAPPLLAGLLIAAPFAAVMSTVDSFLLLISSGLVRDVYQRNINPEVSERTIKILSYSTTMVVGVLVTILALDPPAFIQDIIVFTGVGAASTFLAVICLGLFWKRTTKQGAAAALAGGFSSVVFINLPPVLSRHDITFMGDDILQPYGIPEIVIGLGSSFALGIIVSLLTPAPSQKLIKTFFAPRRSSTASGVDQNN